MKVSLGDMKISDKCQLAILQNLRAGRITEGPETETFEKALAEYMGTKYAVACSSGTSALFIIFDVLRDKLSSRRRAITSPLTYAATTNVLRYLGYEIALVDIDSETYGLDAERVNRFMDRTWDETDTILFPVHLLGYPVNLKKLDYSLLTVNDSCEAVGSKGVANGYATAVSFYPSHTLQVGEMGAVLTDDSDFAYQCRLAKDNGRNRKDFANSFVHQRLGLNFKTNDIAATIGNYQLQYAHAIIERRQNIARMYCEELPYNLEKGRFTRDCSYLGFPIVLKSPREKLAMVRHLEKNEIEVRSMFPLIPNQPAYRNVTKERFPVAQRISNCGLYLPTHQFLSDEQVRFVIEKILECLK